MTGNSGSVGKITFDTDSTLNIRPTDEIKLSPNTWSIYGSTWYKSGELELPTDGKLTINLELNPKKKLTIHTLYVQSTKTYSKCQHNTITLSEELWTSLMRDWGGEISTLNFLLGMQPIMYEAVPVLEKQRLQEFLSKLLINTVSTPPAEIPTSLAITS